MKIEFIKDKTTKNTIRFTALTDEVSGSIYVAKDSEMAKEALIAVEVLEKHPAELSEAEA
jgi:hypothetical protein